MSQLPPTSPVPPAGGGTLGAGRRRPASITLRDQGAAGEADVASLMDPATKSLADALRITYRLVQVGMVALLVLFALSGLQSVRTGERGIRLVFGKPDGADLAPGFQFTLPEPVGELVKVGTGAQSVRLDREFWPKLREEDQGKTLEEVKTRGKSSLDPESDGSMLTGDGNLAHARFSVLYRRENIKDFAQKVAPEDEQRLVKSAVMRGVVHAAAAVTIDELRTGLPDPERQGKFQSLSARAKLVAQSTLEAMGVGIVIDDLSIQEPTAPFFLYPQFESVQTSQSEAKKQIEEANKDRIQRLNATAGAAAEPLLALIGLYDRQLGAAGVGEGGASGGNVAKAEETLAAIDAVLEGQAARAGEIDVPVGLISGEAAKRLSSAREYRSAAVSRAAADTAAYERKLAAFGENPAVVMTGEWTDAFTRFVGREHVEVYMLPPGSRPVQMALNRDADLVRKSALQRQREAAKNRSNKAIEENETNRFTNTPQGRVVKE